MNQAQEFHGLLNDICFKHLFSIEKHLKCLLRSCSFLKEYDLSNLKIDEQKYLKQFEYAHKAMYSDVVVDTGNVILDIEAQTSFDLEALNKSKAYAHALSGYQLNHGNSYKNMKPLVQIIFAKNVSSKLTFSKEFLDHFHVMNDNLECYHSDDFHIYLIQVDKTQKEGYNDNERFKLLMEMMNADSLEQVKELAKGDEGLMDMATEIEDFLYGKKAMDLFGDRKRFEEKYLEQGRSEGIEQTKEENARRMLLETNDYDFISRVTGLTIEQIKKLS